MTQVKIAFMPETLRYSTLLQMLRKHGCPQDQYDDFVALKARVGSHCAVHGELKDPVIAHAGGDQVAFICPHCSSPKILAAWEKEGMRS
jgi:hypothetical protein